MKYKINKGFITQKIGDKTTIFDGEKSTLYTFNKTASFIFQKLKTGRSREEIIENVSKKFTVDTKKAARDTSELINELRKLKIISIYR